MKMYVFKPIDNSYKVSYLTNAVSTNDRLFINEIKSEKAGVVTTGLISEGQTIGLPHDYLETTHKVLKAKAAELGLNLFVYEDGESVVDARADNPQFITFTIPTYVSSVIDHTAETITVHVLNGTVVTGLVAAFTVNNGVTVRVGVTLQTSTSTANNFTSPVVYLVRGSNGTTVKTYTVTVIVD